jgi:hypothetical protein
MGQRAGWGSALPDQGAQPGALSLRQHHDVLLAHARLLQRRDPQPQEHGAGSHNTQFRADELLALTLRALGDLAGARDLLQQVVDVTRRLLGAEHPTTRAAAKNLAWVQRALAEAAQ